MKNFSSTLVGEIVNWTRRQTDKDVKHYKEWRAGRGRYRIIWRDQAFGVTVSPGYQCCVRIFIPEIGSPMWDFVDRNHGSLYRTIKAAKDACEKHADPNYKPVKKKKKGPKGKAPMKTCSQCGTEVHVRRKACECGCGFPVKRKKK